MRKAIGAGHLGGFYPGRFVKGKLIKKLRGSEKLLQSDWFLKSESVRFSMGQNTEIQTASLVLQNLDRFPMERKTSGSRPGKKEKHGHQRAPSASTEVSTSGLGPSFHEKKGKPGS